MAKLNPQPGDTVEFRFKNQPTIGTILRFRVRKQIKLQKLMRNLGIKDDYPTEHKVVEIAVPGRGIFTGPVNCIIDVVERNPKKAQAAAQYAADLRNNNASVKGERLNKNYEAAKKHGLVDLKLPALVWVRYKGNFPREEAFLGLSPSWQVKIRTMYGKVRFLPPQAVFATKELFIKG